MDERYGVDTIYLDYQKAVKGLKNKSYPQRLTLTYDITSEKKNQRRLDPGFSYIERD